MAINRRLWRSAWAIIGAAPLWLKIVGTTVYPLLSLGFVFSWLFRQELESILQEQGYAQQADQVYSLLVERTIIGVLAGVLVGVVMSITISRLLVRPLKNLIGVINQVEAGDLSARVTVWANDEIGKVQEAFNQMVASLQASREYGMRRERELKVFNDLAEFIVLEQDVDTILTSALKRISELMETDSGAIYILNKHDLTFEIKALTGAVSAEMEQAVSHLPALQTPMQPVLDTGKPIVLRDLREAPELSPAIKALLQQDLFTAWVSAPIKIKGEIVGTINLGSRNERSFADEDLELLESFCNIVGVALHNSELLRDLQHKELELRRTLQVAIEAQESERKRLSRELHDEVGQALTSILLRLKVLQDEKDITVIGDRLNGLRLLTSQTLEEIRRMAGDLRPMMLDDLGLLAAIRWYVQKCAEHSKINIVCKVGEDVGRLKPEIESVLYRVVQEGVTNILRHSQASNAYVIIERTPRKVLLTISDDGKGIRSDREKLTGLGLIGMRERVSLVGGQLRIESVPDEGTRILVELPV